jgi:hypothetical protein
LSTATSRMSWQFKTICTGAVKNNGERMSKGSLVNCLASWYRTFLDTIYIGSKSTVNYGFVYNIVLCLSSTNNIMTESFHCFCRNMDTRFLYNSLPRILSRLLYTYLQTLLGGNEVDGE